MKKIFLIAFAFFGLLSLSSWAYLKLNPTTPVSSCKASPEIPDFEPAPFVDVSYYHGFRPTCGQPPFFINLAPRFTNRITKSELKKAKTILEIVPNHPQNRDIISFRDVKITRLGSSCNRPVRGDGNKLNAEQLALLSNIDYSTNFCIEAICKKTNFLNPIPREECFVYYMTLMPEQEAEFIEGKEALIQYLQENISQETAQTNRSELRPGTIEFTVSKEGTLEDIQLSTSSGYEQVDQKLVSLMKNLDKKWKAASNADGEPVEQKLTIFFGMEGC